MTFSAPTAPPITIQAQTDEQLTFLTDITEVTIDELPSGTRIIRNADAQQPSELHINHFLRILAIIVQELIAEEAAQEHSTAA